MKTYTEPARELPVAGEYDVIVAGGGPAGVSAAINAARQGASTLLIEAAGDVGGVATTGMMSHWTGNTRGGFYEELLDRSCAAEGVVDPAKRQTINPETLKTVLLKLLEESGAELRLYTMAVGAIVESGRVRGLITESKSGREAWYAHTVIDATGDGDVAALAGAEYEKGRESDGLMQPMTLMFKVAGVDESRVEHLPGMFEDNYGGWQERARAALPSPAGHVLLYASTLPGVVTCNMTNVTGVDGTRASDLTRATVACRRQIPLIVKFLRENIPGFENCYAITSASIVGVRETRRFKGLYSLTREDVESARQFDDWVVREASFNLDVHNITGSGLDATGVQKEFRQTRGYQIPYRCLIPEKLDGLLLAGRDISGTHMAHSSYRVMPICANVGEAAGIAAAIAAALDISVREVDAKEIQEREGKDAGAFS